MLVHEVIKMRKNQLSTMTTMSVQHNLNCLHEEGDLPDAGRKTSEDVKKSFSVQNLSVVSGDTERLYRKKEKKKRARLAKGVLDFFNLADPTNILAIEGKYDRSYKLPESKSSGNLASDQELSSNFSDDSPYLRRERRITIGTGLVEKSHEKNARRKTTQIESSISKALSVSTNSLHVPLQNPSGDVETKPRSKEVPPLPQWKTMLDVRVSKDVNAVFELLLTDSQLYRSWLAERKSDNIHNILVSDWTNKEANVTRTISYETTRSFGIMAATVKVSQTYVQADYCTPGKVYGVLIDTTNSGIAYADSFIIHEHMR